MTIEGPAWIGHGSRLRQNSTVRRSVLFEYTRISEDAQFEDVVASPVYCVDKNGKPPIKAMKAPACAGATRAPE